MTGLPGAQVIALGTAGAAMLIVLWAAVTDVRARRIPNAASLLLIAAYAAFVVAHGVPMPWWSGLAAGGLLLALGLPAFALGWFGGGDVKLAAALGLWAGLEGLGAFLAVTAGAGGVLALVVLGSAALRTLRPAADGRAASRPEATLPYGVAIAAGGFWTLSHTFPI
jgi:prepilin peptidase CpaA